MLIEHERFATRFVFLSSELKSGNLKQMRVERIELGLVLVCELKPSL